jgi:hypothetical protein
LSWRKRGESETDLLTTGEKQKGQSADCYDGSADGKKELHAIEKEEHDKKRDGCTQWQAEGLHRVQRLNICNTQQDRKWRYNKFHFRHDDMKKIKEEEPVLVSGGPDGVVMPVKAALSLSFSFCLF